MNVLDLFSGIGGFSLGLERAGMRTVAFCEIDPYCRAVLRKHWPDVPIFEDIRAMAAYRDPESPSNVVLHNGRIFGESGGAIRSKPAIDVGRSAAPDEDAQSTRCAASQTSNSNSEEAVVGAAQVSGSRGEDYSGTGFGGEGTRSGVFDVRESRNGHRPHLASSEGRSNGIVESAIAMQTMPPQEVPRGQKGGINGSLQIVGPIDVICGGFP